MENGKYTASPEHSLLLRHGSGLDDDDEEAEESRLDFNFDAIDADIDLDESVRSSTRFNGLSGHESLAGMTDISEGLKPRKTIDRWSASTGKPATMTLKEQEKVIDELKKDSFSLKLRIYFLEERLAKISPEHVDQAIHENIEMKVRLQTMASELRQYKRLLLEAHAAIEALQNQKNCDLVHGMSQEQEEEYQQAIAERLDLKSALKQLTQKVQDLESQLRLKGDELQNHLDASDGQAGTIGELQGLAAKYKDQIQEMQAQIQQYQRNETRMTEKSQSDEDWEARCRVLEQDLSVSLEVKSELEHALEQARGERDAFEEDMNFQVQEYRDEISKLNLQTTELTEELQNNREQLRQVQEMHANDMNVLSEEWTVQRQQLREEVLALSNENEELKRENDELAPQVQDLLMLREEDEERHHQEMSNLVAELEDKAVDIERMAMELDQLREAATVLSAKDERIAQLEDMISHLELAKQENEVAHGEIVARMRSNTRSASTGDVREGGVSEDELRLVTEELANIEEQNRKLQSRIRLEVEQRKIVETSLRDRESNGFMQWEDERRQLERELAEKTEDLEEKLLLAQEQITKMSIDLDDREKDIRYLEEQNDLASKQNKELEDRYDEMELKLGSATTAELQDIRQEFEQIKASRVEKGELLHARSDEVDRLNVKNRKLNDSMAALEDEKIQLETSLRDRSTTIAMLKSRLNELELQVSKNQWTDDEQPTNRDKDDLVERNSLLLTVLQHLESILGGDSRLDGNMLPKPSANFEYFSGHL
ncbi:hypothetical protein BG004_005322, partial [Podila humilis]